MVINKNDNLLVIPNRTHTASASYESTCN